MHDEVANLFQTNKWPKNSTPSKDDTTLIPLDTLPQVGIQIANTLKAFILIQPHFNIYDHINCGGVVGHELLLKLMTPAKKAAGAGAASMEAPLLPEIWVGAEGGRRCRAPCSISQRA